LIHGKDDREATSSGERKASFGLPLRREKVVCYELRVRFSFGGGPGKSRELSGPEVAFGVSIEVYRR
jgi:hypothetical protein